MNNEYVERLFMKKLSLTLISIIALPLSSLAQDSLHFSAGQSFSYTFSTLDFVQSGALVEQSGGVSFYRLAQPSPNDAVLLELFENNLQEAPVASQVFTDRFGDPTGFGRGGLWQDLQGAVRLTVVSGSMDLTGLRFTVGTGPLDFNYYQTFVAVPEPGTLGLSLLIGGCVLTWHLARRRCNKRTST